MSNELDERKQAMLMYHVQRLSKAEICRRLKRSRPWLDRWLDRYNPGEVENSLQDRQSGPKMNGGEWSTQVRQQVIAMRRSRSQDEQWRYAFLGAEAIHLELKALGNPEVPPARTIHRWFVAAGLVEHSKKQAAQRESKPIPIPAADVVNQVQQLDLKGPIYLEGSPAKYYLAVLRDRF